MALPSSFEESALSLLFEKYDLPSNVRNMLSSTHMVVLSNEQMLKPSHEGWLDLGFFYLGMGHCCVLSFSKTHQKFFLRRDGGSSDHDRKSNKEFYDNVNLDNHPNLFFDSSKAVELLSNEISISDLNMLQC